MRRSGLIALLAWACAIPADAFADPPPTDAPPTDAPPSDAKPPRKKHYDFGSIDIGGPRRLAGPCCEHRGSADERRTGALPILAALIPGIVVPGAGSFVKKERKTALHLLEMAGIGAGLAVAGGVPLVV